MKSADKHKNLIKALKDIEAFLFTYQDKGFTNETALFTVAHDIQGLANEAPCFLPRTSGWAGKLSSPVDQTLFVAKIFSSTRE